MHNDLKIIKPEIFRFIEIWSSKNSNRKFDFSKENDKTAFCEAIMEITHYFISSADNASFIIVPSQKGIEQLYIKTNLK